LSEGISLTLLEAMARGLPVVATRVGGNPEVVEDGGTGFLVPAGDPETLAPTLLRVWSDVKTSREMGQRGRLRVEQFFDIQKMVTKYQSLYTQLSERGW
jgi:glycosyltransferase involved in cell wall biosynthesis